VFTIFAHNDKPQFLGGRRHRGIIKTHGPTHILHGLRKGDPHGEEVPWGGPTVSLSRLVRGPEETTWLDGAV
jgi:hypothetical protein